MAPGDHASHSEVRLAEVDLALAGQPVEQEEPLRLAGVEPAASSSRLRLTYLRTVE